MMRIFIGLLAVCTAAFAFAAEETYEGVNVGEGVALQMNLCSLNPRKSMADYNRVYNAYVEWSKENGAELYSLRATPLFGGPEPGAAMQFDFIDFLISPYAVAGNGWHQWLNTEEGREINEDWIETADCRVVINTAFIQYLDTEALAESDSRIMTINWCTRHDGVTWDALNARHQMIRASRPDDSPVKAWTVMFPGLGIRNPLGEFAHLVTYADARGLMAAQNALANQEGWRNRADYYASYASCSGENVYAMEVVHRP